MLKKNKAVVLLLVTFYMINLADFIRGSFKYEDLFRILELSILGYYLFKVYQNYPVKKSKIITLLSVMFALFQIIGYSYKREHSIIFLFSSPWQIVLTFLSITEYFLLFRIAMHSLYEYIDNLKFKKRNSKIITLLNKYPFLVSLLIILICWLPYIISFYPAILSPDPSNQIMQFMGIRTKYNDYSIMLDENVLITNHHPVLHTVLLGGCFKIGHLIGNDNLGLFFYSFMQVSILACTLAYTIKYMLEKMNVPAPYALICLFMYAVIPAFPLYSLSVVKDVLYSCFVLILVMCLHYIINNK